MITLSLPHVAGVKCDEIRRPDNSEIIERGRCLKMYAIIETGGKQYRVQEGDTLFIEKLPVEADSEVVFDKVIAVGNEGDLKIGSPIVEGAKVVAKAIKNGKAKKITVFTYRPKKDSKRKMGHRQPYTKVEITSINA